MMLNSFGPLLVILIGDSLMPLRFSNANNKVRHNASIIGAVPVSRARRSPNSVSSVDSLRLAALVADPSATGQHSNHLSSDVGVPMRPSAWGEGNVCDDGAFVAVDEFHVDIAGESSRWLCYWRG